MAGKEKPYKVYRAGRGRGPARPLRESPREPKRDGRDGKAKLPRPRRPRRWRRTIVLLLVGLVVLAIVWALLGYLAVRRGVNASNERLSEPARAALAPPDGSILTTATHTLVLGADVEPGRSDREGPGRADSIVLIRTDPDENRIAYLSIPRDLQVEIPGRGADKINASYTHGGAGLAVQTVNALTGLDVHHVVVVDFAGFREVIDSVGGITINNPKRVLSNPFECPYNRERCADWRGWRFPKGELHLDGRRALIYSRIRKNQLDPSESDITRAERQQRVIQALTDKIVGFYGYFHMPFIGDDLVRPMTTDLSANELLQLAWVRRRASGSNTLRCRLGGTPVNGGGLSYIQSSEDNASVIAMITGQTAPQPPRAEEARFGPGCFVGRAE